MRRCLILYGLTCLIGQVLALREIAVLFYGNELIYGGVLAAWLLLVAIGSGPLGRLAEKRSLSIPAFAATLAAGGALVPITLLLVRLARWIMVGRTGLTPSFGTVLLTTLITLMPLCLVLGFFYALACAIAMRAREHGAEGSAAGPATRLYVFEALGTVIGGVLFTFVLIHLLDALLIATALAAVNCFAAFAVWRHDEHRGGLWGWGLPVLGVIFAVTLIPPVGKLLDFASQVSRFPNSILKDTQDTPYGRVDVAETEGHMKFYQSGVLAGATYLADESEAEVFPALLSHPAPRRMLLIGGFVTGALKKAADVPWLHVDCVELDPALVEAVRRFAPWADVLKKYRGRVNVFGDVDGRLFVKRASNRYDVILSTVPNPSSGLINRFYTVEFFREVKAALSENGVFAFALDGPPDYMSAPHRKLASNIYRALRQTFTSVAALPTDSGILYLACPAKRRLFPDVAAWQRRMRSWRVRTVWLKESHLKDMTDLHEAQSLLKVLKNTPISALNSDLHPLAYYQTLLLWADAFQIRGQGLLNWALEMDVWTVAFGVALMTSVLALIVTFARRRLWIGVSAVRVYAGMAGFVLELVLVFAFQSFYGHVYSYLGLLFAAFMVGITLGAVLGRMFSTKPDDIPALILLQTILAVLAAAAVPILQFLARADAAVAQYGAILVIPLLNLCVGATVGAQYPISVSAGRGDGGRSPGGTKAAAVLYAMELLGACLGALVGGTVLIPVLGIPNSCWVVCLLCLASLPLLLLSGRRT